MSDRFVVASANPDKAAEIKAILVEELGPGVELVDRPSEIPDVVEDADTLLGNACLKAAAIAESTNANAIADDTGLEVDALDGAPGVYSARYAGDHATYADNVAKLLAALEAEGAIEAHRRTARFATVAVMVAPDGTQIIGEGEVTGHIALAASGEGGFGYDPVFIPDEGDGRSFAEMSSVDKHAISHRGRALRALAKHIARWDG